MSFGFSAGDFITALQVVGTLISALRESTGASSEYRELVNELNSLETALLRVKQLELEEDQRSEYISLRHAAAQCQQTISNFWKQIQKYEKSLRPGGSGSTVKDGFMKIRWALYKSEDLIKFKVDIAAHTQSIHILLTALQMDKLRIQGGKRHQEHNSLSRAIQQLTDQCMCKLDNVTAVIGDVAVKGLQILENTARILRTNILIFQTVSKILNIITTIPNQIERQQPVYMIDALGRLSPFYLEFIRSLEALKAVLKINFEKIPSGQRKIGSGDFKIHDIAAKRQINLERDWETCFLPGQRVEMRMVFHRNTRKRKRCPGCGNVCDDLLDRDIGCEHCGLSFRRVVEFEEAPDSIYMQPKKRGVKDHVSTLAFEEDLSKAIIVPRPPKTAYDEAEDVRHYRRVEIMSRKRRRIWEHELTDGDSTPLFAEIPPIPRTDLLEVTDTHHDGTPIASNLDSAFNEMIDCIDRQELESLIEMDDDDELEFSRSIVLGSLELLAPSFRRIEVVIQELDIHNLTSTYGIVHFYRGTPSTLGMFKVAELFRQIYRFERKDGETDDELRIRLKGILDEAEKEFKIADEKLRAFYRL